MTRIVDTYMGDACSEREQSTLRKLNLPLPAAEHWLTVSRVRELTQEFGMEVHAVTSLGTWNFANKYVGENGKAGEIGEHDPEGFFRSINGARFELAEQNGEIPEGELWYAKMGGHFLEKLVPHLKENAHLFNGVKIGAFMPPDFDFLDEKYDELWKFCEEKNWPVLMHCSKENPKTFFQIIELAKRYPNARFCASHLGGENPEEIDKRAMATADITPDKRLPDNFFLNMVVRDFELAKKMLKGNPELLSRLVYGTDVPFLGTYGEVQRKLQESFTPTEIEKMMANGRRFLMD